MEHLNFAIFRDQVNAKFLELASNKNVVLTRSSLTGDQLYAQYLNAYPAEVNSIFRERPHYDGNYDKNYIRKLGNIVAILPDGTLDTIWNTELPGYFKHVANTLHTLLLSEPISTFFLVDEKTAGSKPTVDNHNKEITWTHFHSVVPSDFVKHDLNKVLGDLNTTLSVFKRSLQDFSLSAAETINELIEDNNLYRGQDYKQTIKLFIDLKKEFDVCTNKDVFLFQNVVKHGFSVRFRSSVIGTLLEDLSNDVNLEGAIASFENKVSGTNYKRPKALITPRMIEEAQQKIAELGLEDSLERRFATEADINVSDILFKAKPVKVALNVFDDLKEEASHNVVAKNLSSLKQKAIDISVDEFINNVLNKAQEMELLFENKHQTNLMSLVAPIAEQPKQLFKWDNNFSWSYKGNIADSELRTKVQRLGGRVDGCLRFSHTWNYDEQLPNQSLMDLHVFFPGCLTKTTTGVEIHNLYPTGRRVGWNNRTDKLSGANQDVDHVEAPGKSIPVENITFPSLEKMPEGVYTFKIHNWKHRKPTVSGFKAEIEFDNQIFEYERKEPLQDKEWVTLAEVILKNGSFEIEHKMEYGTATQTVWGVTTNQFVPVDLVTFSPNYWGENQTGNQHLFFLSKAVTSDEEARGMYNEFLRSDLEQHRKVFEVLAGKLKTTLTDAQLNGFGFSLTKRDSVIVRVTTGKKKQILRINF